MKFSYRLKELSMNIQEICNNSDLFTLLIFVAVLVIAALLIVRNILKFQQQTGQWRKQVSSGTLQFVLGPNGKIEVSETEWTNEHDGRKKKIDPYPNILGCLFQQFMIAALGFLIAIIFLTTISNLPVTMSFQSVCYKISNIGTTPITGLTTERILLEPQNLSTSEVSRVSNP
jgi:hypothetical protein